MEPRTASQTLAEVKAEPRAFIISQGERSQWLASVVSGEGYAVSELSTLREARAVLANSPRPDVLLISLNGTAGGGMLDELGETSQVSVVAIGDQSTAESTVQTLRRRGIDYVSEPVDREYLRALLADIAAERRSIPDESGQRPAINQRSRFCDLVGVSKPMQRIYDLVERVGPTNASVIVTGESGTGKEVVARAIHATSSRHAGPFEAINCGAISPQLFESELFGHERGSFTGADRRHKGCVERASGGTLFFDEITEMSAELQVKLLRILETGLFTRVGGETGLRMDARVLAATNRDVSEAVADGTLREDLYYRLKVFQVYLPPLRDRPEDVELLVAHFLERLGTRGVRKQFTEEALAALRGYAWPGNVRELKNVVHSASIMARNAVIDTDALPDEVLRRQPRKEFDASRLSFLIGLPLAEVERRLILSTLAHHRGNKSQTAKVLGISLKTLYTRLHRYESAPTES